MNDSIMSRRLEILCRDFRCSKYSMNEVSAVLIISASQVYDDNGKEASEIDRIGELEGFSVGGMHF